MNIQLPDARISRKTASAAQIVGNVVDSVPFRAGMHGPAVELGDVGPPLGVRPVVQRVEDPGIRREVRPDHPGHPLLGENIEVRTRPLGGYGGLRHRRRHVVHP